MCVCVLELYSLEIFLVEAITIPVLAVSHQFETKFVICGNTHKNGKICLLPDRFQSMCFLANDSFVLKLHYSFIDVMLIYSKTCRQHSLHPPQFRPIMHFYDHYTIEML